VGAGRVAPHFPADPLDSSFKDYVTVPYILLRGVSFMVPYIQIPVQFAPTESDIFILQMDVYFFLNNANHWTLSTIFVYGSADLDPQQTKG
jgi:hypothetical protein